jgi:hypothetical protein
MDDRGRIPASAARKGGGPSVKALRAWLKALPKTRRQPADAEHAR